MESQVPRPYTQQDFDRGALIVKQLHGLEGFSKWAQHIAQALAAERERCADLADRDGQVSVARGIREQAW